MVRDPALPAVIHSSRVISDDNRASELLQSLPKEHRQAPHFPFSPPPQQLQLSSPHLGPRPSLGDFLPPPGPLEPLAGPSRSYSTSHGVEVEEEEDVLEEDRYQLAKGYFDMKEFDRVVWVLQGATGRRAKFLRVYSAYLVWRSFILPDYVRA